MDLLFLFILVVWVYIIKVRKKGSIDAFLPAIILFICGGLLAIFGFREFGEFFTRISFIGLTIGLVFSIIEYKKNGKGDDL